jgi:streptogramin lyase
VTIFAKQDDEQRTRRANFRKSTRNRLFWSDGSESPRLEPRTMLSLTITSFQIPEVALVQPGGITTASDGNLWFTEGSAGRIGRMTPSGAITSFPLPDIPPPAGSPAGTTGTTPDPTAITVGPDGAFWFTGIPGEIGRITMAGVVTEFALPAVPPPPGSSPGTASKPAMASAITEGPDGALWFTGVPGEIGRITTRGKVTEFAVPVIPPPAGSSPGTAPTLATLTAITAGPDGALWFTGVPGEIGRITTAGVVTEFAVPAIPPPAGSSPGTAPTQAALEDITAGPDGSLWFTGVPGKIGRITTTGVVTEFAIPALAPPAGSPPQGTGDAQQPLIVRAPDGHLWFAVTDSSGYVSIGRVTPSGSVSQFNVPGYFNLIAGLTPGPDGNIWFTEQEDGNSAGEQPAVGEITPAGVTTLHPIPQGMTVDAYQGVNADPQALTAGPDGAMWFTEDDAIGLITPGGAIQRITLPTVGATPVSLTAGPGDTMWFTQQVTYPNGNQTLNGSEAWSIGRITASRKITVYPLPLQVSNVGGITEGPDGNIWFTETSANSQTLTSTVAIARITPGGNIQTFALPQAVENGASAGNITVGPDRNLWFPISYNDYDAIGRITAKGKVKIFNILSTYGYGSYPPSSPSDIVSGPDRTLWFEGTVNGTGGIARISTSGKLGAVIPEDSIGSNMLRLPNGQVWFVPTDSDISIASELGVVTRSGIVATQDLPSPNGSYEQNLGAPYTNVLARSPGGDLWATSGANTIMRISEAGAVIGSLDYRHRPKQTLDYSYDGWTNVSGSATPTFAGVATPGAEVTLWAQKQGVKRPVSIGHVEASKSNGSWTLTSHRELENGTYAITAAETGQKGPRSVLYSLKPDYYGDLSNALVIATSGAATANAGQGAQHVTNASAAPHGSPDGTGKSHDHLQQAG